MRLAELNSSRGANESDASSNCTSTRAAYGFSPIETPQRPRSLRNGADLGDGLEEFIGTWSNPGQIDWRVACNWVSESLQRGSTWQLGGTETVGTTRTKKDRSWPNFWNSGL